MSNHYDYEFKKEKCWSCAHYCGQRELRYGKFHTSDKGNCAYKREEVSESSYCWHYKLAGDVASELAKEENDKLQKELEKKEREKKRLEEEIEAEQRKSLYEQWYSSLSPEKKAKEDERKRKEAREREKKWKQQTVLNKSNELEKKVNSIKQKMPRKIIFCVVITTIVSLLSFIPHWLFNSAKEYNEELLQIWMEDHSSTDQTSVELASSIEMYAHKAQNSLWILVAVLVVCIVLSIFAIIKTRKKQFIELETLTTEMNNLKKEIAELNVE